MRERESGGFLLFVSLFNVAIVVVDGVATVEGAQLEKLKKHASLVVRLNTRRKIIPTTTKNLV